MSCGSVSYLLKSPNLLPPSRIVRPSFDNLSAPSSHLRQIHPLLIMSLAAFLPLRSPYPYHRSPPDAFSSRVNFSPRLVPAPMSRVPRIQTSSRRDSDLPRDPSDWVDKDLLSYVQYNYSPVEASSLSAIIERDRLTPRALWYLQAEPEQLFAIAEEESLRDTLLGLALSLKPSVSPTTPRVRHVRRLSEDLERPPPPPPPPPPPSTPPTPEEPELEEDDDVAESIVSDWALDEDLDDDHSPTPAVDDLGNLTASAAQPEPSLEGLGLHTGESHLDAVTTPQPQPIPIGTDDLINLEDDLQPTVTQEEAPDPHATHTDVDPTYDPPVEEPTSSQSASTGAHVPNVTEEKPAAATHHADPPAPPDEPSAFRDAGAGMPADPNAGSNTFASPIEDDDLVNPWLEDPLQFDTLSTPAVDPARTATPTSDYHDATSTHGDEGERREAPALEQQPEPSLVHPQQRDGPATSGDEEQSTVEVSPPAEVSPPDEIPDEGESGETTSSGDDAPTREEEQQENSVPAPSEEPAQPPPATTEPAQSPPATTDPVSPPSEETTQAQEGHASPATDPAREETTYVGLDDSKDTQPEELSAQSTSSGIPASEQSQETVEAEDRKSGDLGGEEAIGEVDEDEEVTVSPTTTTEPAETTAPPVATPEAVDKSPATEESSEGEASGAQGNDQPSATETSSVQAEAERDSLSPAQSENASETSPVRLDAPVIESIPLHSLAATTTETAVSDVPPSPTIMLRSGIEAQLLFRDPESTEQTPSASPSDTPPNASPSPSESRQASPPAETKAEKPPTPPPASRVHILPSSLESVSSVGTTEKKSLAALEPIKTAFDPAVSRTAPNPASTTSRSGSFGPGRPAWSQATTISPSAKPPAWGSAAQSPAGKAKSMFSSFTSSMSSFAFGSSSEPATRNASQEREHPAPRTPVIPASPRQLPGAGQGQWGQKRNWVPVESPPTLNQQSRKSSLPPPPAIESSGNASPAPVPDPTRGKPASTPEPSPPEGSTTQKTDPEAEKEATEALSDGVVVDSGMPSVENGEPVRYEEIVRAPPVGTGATPEGSPDGNDAKGQDDTNDADDEDMINITADDVAEAGFEPQPQEGLNGGEDEDEDTPLDRRLERVRQITGDSVSSVVTSDAEIQGDDGQSGRGMGPKLQTSGLSNEAEDVGSPAGESPIVGSPSTTISVAERKRLKKARNKANKSAKGTGC